MRVTPVSLYQNVAHAKCPRNLLGMVRSNTIGRCNWCLLTSASPPQTKIFVRGKTQIILTSSHSDRFYKKTVNSPVKTHKRKMRVKNDHSSEFFNLSNWKEEA